VDEKLVRDHGRAERVSRDGPVLIARYADPEMPYEVKRRRGPFARAYDYDEYEHLARVKEWLTQEAEEEFR
jgi:hypothetical protein